MAMHNRHAMAFQQGGDNVVSGDLSMQHARPVLEFVVTCMAKRTSKPLTSCTESKLSRLP